MTVPFRSLLVNGLRAQAKTIPRRGLATPAASDRFVTIVECSARDGLQNEKKPLSTELKAELITRLSQTGIKYIEGGSFVSPKWVPQMAGTDKVLKRVPQKDDLHYLVLAPNVRAVQDIVATDSQKISDEIYAFAAASEGFSRANTNCTIAEGLDRMAKTVEAAAKHGIKARGSISCTVGSPFERGVTDPRLVRDVAKKMTEAGCHLVSLADTIGVGTPRTVQAMIEEVQKDVPASRLGIHVHDTFGCGVANVLAALNVTQCGIRVVDSSAGGLGGCPYAPGATGNVSTEDVLYALHNSGYETGVDLAQISEIGEWISEQVSRSNSSRAGNGTLAKIRSQKQDQQPSAA